MVLVSSNSQDLEKVSDRVAPAEVASGAGPIIIIRYKKTQIYTFLHKIIKLHRC